MFSRRSREQSGAARTPLEHLARTPLERQNEMCTTPPPQDLCNHCTYRLTHRHTVQQHHTACVQTIHTHTPQQLANNQPTNKPTNQPTNQPTHQPNSAVPEPINQQPTNQQAKHQCTQGGGVHKLGGGGTKHTTDPHSTAPDARAVHKATPYHRHTVTHVYMAGRREGVTHLPLGVTVYPLLDIHIGEKKPAHLQRGKEYPP